MSNSHKAINNLLAVRLKVARQERTSKCAAIKKATSGDPDSELLDPDHRERLHESTTYGAATPSWWPAPHGCLPMPRLEQSRHLFVDEAGQVALANLVAAGTCARNIVLLGDQMQLGQPIQGVHPGSSGESALDYLLDGQATIAPDRGIFLATSWRMHRPCAASSRRRFTRAGWMPRRRQPQATPRAGRHRRTLRSPGGHRAFCPCSTRVARKRSEAEAARGHGETYESALAQRYIDKNGNEHRMTHRQHPRRRALQRAGEPAQSDPARRARGWARSTSSRGRRPKWSSSQ